MIRSFLLNLKSSHDEIIATRRRHPRRSEDRCVAVIYGQTFPVGDWSFGGVQIDADERLFGTHQEMDVGLKFRLGNRILDVAHKGRVVRKGRGRVALQFEPLTRAVRHVFQTVIDDHAAQEFANSQAT